MEAVPEQVQREILRSQRNEITEHRIYSRLAKATGNGENEKVLRDIAADELRHYEFWKEHTGCETRRNRVMDYREIARYVPGALEVAEEEDAHEEKLIGLISEERLNYVGSIVLGLNDALVELTGALAGLSLAFRDTRLIALAGLITGIAASLSMAASEYLSTKAEGETENAITSALYTGAAYVATVTLLIMPFLLLSHYLVRITLGVEV